VITQVRWMSCLIPHCGSLFGDRADVPRAANHTVSRSTGGGGRRVSLLASVGVLIAVIALPVQGTAAATPPQRSAVVREWNLHAVEALINAPTAPTPGAGQTPPVSQLHLAMVQVAVYDAVNAIEGGYQSYLPDLPPASPSASLDAAVATAAHDVLVGLGIAPVPPLPQVVLDRLDALYAAALAGIPGGDAKTEGVAAGAAAAAAMLAARTNDGRYVPFSWQAGTAPGEWRPTPPAFVNDPFAWVARVQPFMLESTSQFRTKGPLSVASRAYAREYNEVKTLGSLTGSARTPEQEALAQFYTVNPVELFNRTFRAIAAAKTLTIAEEVRLFAMLNLAGADALINCWDDKAFWSFWRPVTAIHEGDNDGNPRTVGDPTWMSLINAPPYPDHPSGYNCVAAAYMYTARSFFGTDKMDFTVVKTLSTPDVTRSYERFTDLVDDTIDARVYEGIHFRTADEQGAWIGKRVARWLDKHFFQRAK
jgi:Vanadium chloroperoxidase N-terminal domain